MITVEEAKRALDSVIEKGRVHLYKPIQVAEILYRDRVCKDIDLSNLEDYRTQSKKWRDAVTISLVGRKCTSSARFQDDLFNANATPPSVLVVLGRENRKRRKKTREKRSRKRGKSRKRPKKRSRNRRAAAGIRRNRHR